jgi:hypothetical protein
MHEERLRSIRPRYSIPLPQKLPYRSEVSFIVSMSPTMVHRSLQNLIKSAGVRPNRLVRGQISSLCAWMEGRPTYVNVSKRAWTAIASGWPSSEE